MGLLSFMYGVLGYNLCATLFVGYLMFDYVMGALATFGARYVMESKPGGAYDFSILWIRVDYGWTELTLTIGPITFKNTKRFKLTPFLVKIDRIVCRVNPRSFLPWVQKKAPMQVENVEIERMRLHMERDGKGEVNVWACLGMDAKAGEAAYADAQKTTDAQEQDVEDVEETGKDEKKQTKKQRRNTLEREEAKHAGGVLGMFAVKRVCLRGHRYDIDAFMRKSKTTKKDVDSNIIKMQILEVFDGRGKKDKKSGDYPGLYLDAVIKMVVIRCGKHVMATNQFTKHKNGPQGGGQPDRHWHQGGRERGEQHRC